LLELAAVEFSAAPYDQGRREAGFRKFDFKIVEDCKLGRRFDEKARRGNIVDGYVTSRRLQARNET
jgi:hypothetical protein